jgi:3-hydroxybutyryl-CoA dehydratase
MKRDELKMVGRAFTARDPYHVTAEKIANFCAAVGEDNPLYIDPVAAKAGPYGGIVAPPGFAASFRYADNVFDQLPALRGGGLMAGIDIEFGAPIRIGDSIRVSSEVKEVYEKTGRTGTMKFVVVRSTLTNQNGDMVAHVDHRMMRRVRG